MPPDETLLAQLPDPRRCKHKNPAAELDRVVRRHPWFRFGFRAGNRRISCDYAADIARPSRPSGTLLVTRIVTLLPGGGQRHTNGPSGGAPPATISRLLRELGGPAPDLTTLWVSQHKQAPKPTPFGDLVSAALVDLLGAKAPPPEQGGAVALAQRAIGSDRELHAFVGLKTNRTVILASASDGIVCVHNQGRRPMSFLSLRDAIDAIAEQHGTKLDPSRTRFERFNHDNRRLGDGPWVDAATLRKLVLAALEDVAARA